MTDYLPGAEPWSADGGPVGVLVVHGFTGTTQSVRPWAEGIAEQGRTVIVPRLPGHGTSVDDLQGTTAADWVGEAEMALRGLGERCDRIFVCGLSMGGTITLDLAARFPDVVRGIAVVNGTVYTTDPRAKLAPLLGRLPLKLKGVANDVADPSQKELAYDRVPTKAAASFLAYQDGVRSRLGRITCPALIFVSRQDHVVHPSNASFIAERIASPEKEVVWLERSYHVATLDFDRDLIVERTNKFIAENAG